MELKNNIKNIFNNNNIKIIIFHYPCIDGLYSTYLLYKYIKGNTIYISFSWNGDLDDKINKIINNLKNMKINNIDLYFLDIFNYTLCNNLINNFDIDNILVLDHHAEKLNQLNEISDIYNKIELHIKDKDYLQDVDYLIKKNTKYKDKNLIVFSDLTENQIEFKTSIVKDKYIKFAGCALVAKFLIYLDIEIDNNKLKFIEIVSEGDTAAELMEELDIDYNIIKNIMYNYLYKVIKNKEDIIYKFNILDKVINVEEYKFNYIKNEYKLYNNYVLNGIKNILIKNIDKYKLKFDITSKLLIKYWKDINKSKSTNLDSLNYYYNLNNLTELKKKIGKIDVYIVNLFDKDLKQLFFLLQRDISNILCKEDVVVVFLTKGFKPNLPFNLSFRCNTNNHLGYLGRLIYKKYNNEVIDNVLMGDYGGGHFGAASHRRYIDELKITFGDKIKEIINIDILNKQLEIEFDEKLNTVFNNINSKFDKLL